MITPFGEWAFLVELDDWRAAQSLAASIEAVPLEGVVEVVPGLRSLLFELDRRADAVAVRAAVEARVARGSAIRPSGRERRIPVVYGGEHGPDLADVAKLCGLGTDEVVARHAAAEVHVLFDGFAPGFAYLGDLPEQLHVPRLATPRTRTPAGSVAVAGSMTGIYPAELPGGWRVIGATPVTLFDPGRRPPAYLVPGDRVRFEPLDVDAWESRACPASDW
ncbi:MAG TPA: 5-oxoprolinase subunit PxpB [Candidatus Limnocylindria bacterium]|nr:5-oxoprolinase subunit PxpB [Candidatus Limnocylindria bacterium]